MRLRQGPTRLETQTEIGEAPAIRRHGEQIEQELRSQYLVTYSSNNKRRDGTYRKMTIEIINPELRKEQLKLTYRPGYFAKDLSKSIR